MPYLPLVAFDAGTPISVSDVDIDYPEAAAQTTGDGGETTTTRSRGAVIMIKVGADSAPVGSYAALVAARADLIAHALTVTLPETGDVLNFDVNWKAKPPVHIRMPGHFDSITIKLTERP